MLTINSPTTLTTGKIHIWSLIYVRGIRITIKVVAFLVKKLEGLSTMGRSLPDGWQAGASGGKVRKLEGSKVERVSGYGPHPSPLLLGEGALFLLPGGERELL
jgi:hypothetical protein